MEAAGRSDLPECLAELADLSAEDETTLLTKILVNGIDQGCLLSLEGRELPELNPLGIEKFLGQLGARDGGDHPEASTEDPFKDSPAPQSCPGDHERRYAVLSQRCDLIKPIAIEPFVEVAPAAFIDATAAEEVKRGSAQRVYLGPDDEDGAWVMDLRSRGLIPKHWLAEVDFHQPVPPGRPRRTVAVRIGARHSREPVPAHLVSTFQTPLRNWLYSSTGRRQLCQPFSEFMILPASDPSEYVLYALIGEDEDVDAAEQAFGELIDKIAERFTDFPLNPAESEAYTPADISLDDYLSACKLDLDRVTWGSKSEDQAEPLR